ncbi:MAG: hypothetical protein ACNYWU_05190 [Desulfobacterales bacterium]
MKNIKEIKIAFTICVVLFLIISAIILLNIRAIPKHTNLIDSGKQIQTLVLEMKLQAKSYLLYHHEDALDNVKDKIGELREILSFYEKSAFAGKPEDFFKFSIWEEAINIYERLFDQLVLYHEAIDKNIAEIRDLEKNILAVIYSKMNPERGIIALQEIRINEKGYIIYRSHPKPPDEISFEDKRKEAVTNFLIWAEKDKRIGELMDKDNQLFNKIMKNYEYRDNTLYALKMEGKKVRDMAEKFLEKGGMGLDTIYRRCAFLSIILLIVCLISAVPIAITLLSNKKGS